MECVKTWLERNTPIAEKTVVLTGYTGASFDSIVEVYAPYKDRFDLWCGLDLSDYGKSSFVKTAVEELKRCHKMGAKGNRESVHR